MAEKRLFELIMDIRRKCLRTEETIRGRLRLSPAEFNGLMSIEPGEKAATNYFAEQMELSPSRASRVISSLMNKGFMAQEQQRDDRRRFNVFLTRRGEEMRERIFTEMSECEKKITDQLSEAEYLKIREALILLSKTM